MIFPVRLYVTADEVLTAGGRDPTSATAAELHRAGEVAELASIVVEHIVGEAGVIAHLMPGELDPVTEQPVKPPPSGAHIAAVTIAGDLWRRPSTPGGYFQVADYVGRLSADPGSPVLALLTPYRESWSIA